MGGGGGRCGRCAGTRKHPQFGNGSSPKPLDHPGHVVPDTCGLSVTSGCLTRGSQWSEGWPKYLRTSVRSAYATTTVLIREPRNRRGWNPKCEQAVIRASLHRAIERARDGVQLRTWSSLVGASTGRPRSARDKGRKTAGSATGSLKGDWTPLARGRKLCVILKRDAGAGNLSLSCRASSSPSSSYTGAEVGCWDSARKAVVKAAPLWSCALPVPEDWEAAGTAGDGLLFAQ